MHQNILRVKFSAAPKRKTNAEKRGLNWLYKILWEAIHIITVHYNVYVADSHSATSIYLGEKKKLF